MLSLPPARRLSPLLVLAAIACSSGGTNLSSGQSAAGASGSGGSSGSAGSSGGAQGGSIGAGNPGGGPSGTCDEDPNTDGDGDGWTDAQGDCDDCDKNINPGAVDVLNYERDAQGNITSTLKDPQIDEDCSGTARKPGENLTCDNTLSVGDIADPFDAAKALGLCRKVQENPANPKDRKWGVIDAAFSGVSGGAFSSPPQMWANSGKDLGILDKFGVSLPQEGVRLLALSTGVARAPGQPGYLPTSCKFEDSIVKGYQSGFPDSTWPKPGSCGVSGKPRDGIALDLKLRAPTNANSLSLKFRFFSCEYPEEVCKSHSDVFAVLMDPSPLDENDSMAGEDNANANIAYEEASGVKRVIGVNNETFLTACTPNSSPATQGYVNCKGEADLQGTGFEGHGASAWLQSTVPVQPGKIIQLRLAIWDSGDGNVDSTALVDGIKFGAEEGKVKTEILKEPK